MTNEEALKDIVESGINLGAGDYVDVDALKVAVKALEKQIPKKPRFGGLNPNYSPFEGSPSKIYCCPTCGMIHLTSGRPKYCEGCGQAIDWTEEAK